MKVSLPLVMSLTGTNWPTATGAPLSRSVPLAGSVAIADRLSKLSGGLLGVAEAEVGDLERVGRVFERADRLVGAARGLWALYRGDVDR